MDSIKGKRLLLLGGSLWKEAILQFAEECGVELISCGNDTTAGIFGISDEKYQVDSSDAEMMKALICEKQIDGVYMGGSEAVINSASKYLNELGMPCYCTQEQWQVVQNKHLFKALCQKFGLPVVPKYEIDINDIEGSVPADVFPVVIKPADGCGSSGFSVCNTASELIASYDEAAKNSPTGTVICEKFVNNNSIEVFYSFSEGSITFAGSEDKTPIKYQRQGSYVAGLFILPSSFEKTFRSRFEDKIKAMFRSIGLYEGSIWMEVFHDGEEYYFNEVGFRYGGEISVYPMDYLSGINQVYRDLYYSITGKSLEGATPSLIPDRISRGKKYCVYPIHIYAGVIEKYEGVEELRQDPEMVLFSTTKPIGADVKDTGSFSQIVALAHFVYTTKNECITMINQIHNVFRVIDVNGKDLVNRMLPEEALFEISL